MAIYWIWILGCNSGGCRPNINQKVHSIVILQKRKLRIMEIKWLDSSQVARAEMSAAVCLHKSHSVLTLYQWDTRFLKLKFSEVTGSVSRGRKACSQRRNQVEWATAETWWRKKQQRWEQQQRRKIYPSAFFLWRWAFEKTSYIIIRTS